MSPERWQQVEELYHEALEREPEGRGTFLRQACGDDAELCSEVESLLAHASTPGLLNRPAWEVAGDVLETRAMPGPGVQLGVYRIEGLLGAGGMGQVYRASDKRLGREVAIKVLRPEGAFDSRRQRRLEHEARAAAALNHPNIVSVYDVGESEGVSFIVSELVAGESLAALLTRGRLAPAQAIGIAAQIAEGLVAAHAAGIVHRDLKPGNIMVVPTEEGEIGRVKILDFGVAEHLVRGEDQATRTSITETGAIVGTIAYMSPEQARGVQVDARSDLWSLGVVLYQMLTGKLPFPGEGPVDILAGIIQREPAAFPGRDVPARLQRIVFKALAKDREQRYSSARDFLGDLRGVGQPATGHRTLSRRAVMGWVAAATVVVGVGAILWRAVEPPERLTLSLIAQKMQDGNPMGDPYTAGTGDVFEAGWRFLLRMQSPLGGVVYVLDEGPGRDGANTLSIQRRSDLESGLTTETDWIRFDENPGVEKLWIVWSQRPVSELEDAVRTAVTTANEGRIDTSRANTIRKLFPKWRIAAEHSAGGGIRLRGRGDPTAAELELRHR
jgi:tRNA A-37 threonylcarbamoyl transferase component Bud32